MKDFDLNLAQERLKEAGSALRRTGVKEEAARKLAQELLSELDEERDALRREKNQLQDDLEWVLAV